ncbi:FAR1-related sequence 5-like protein [Tanacetum coccineum]|uniref:FAR1-related sequence 5-like protein n=1 Tax=Tanacetum coccineum TaxID=301880 RepID=A0ABQ4Y3Z2_9ASTR
MNTTTSSPHRHHHSRDHPTIAVIITTTIPLATTTTPSWLSHHAIAAVQAVSGCCNSMEIEVVVQPNDEPFVAHQIEEIDTNGYLINHDNSEYDSDNQNDDDVDMELEKDEYNDVMAKIFDTLDDAYMFYNGYALLHGFGIRIHTTYKNKVTNEAYGRKFVCNKEGFKDLKGKGPDGGDKKRRRDLRTGCEAFLRININKDRKWFVKEFKNAHNHELTATPTKVMKHRSHGKFHRSMACKSLMSELSHSGLKPCHIKKVVNSMKNPLEPDVTSKQCADVLSEERKQYKGKEFYGLIKHFQDKTFVDKDQYFKVDLFDDGSPRNIFWADGRSRDAYIKFGDVLVFDVTYMTNKFKFPFSPFVGVNHHGQSILFGGALLENEKEETFEWLFEEFKKCMFNKHPTAIITDQDKAMGNAILKVFPNTRHRYCAWHINKHERDHLQPLKTHHTDFKELHREWVKSDTVVEFETRWEVLCDKYNFEQNSWIREMYKKRSHWAKAFFKDIFLAGMTTSGRSESIHSFFDGFVNSSTMLNEFVIQYDKAVEARRAAEEDEDFKTMNSLPVLSSINPIEAKSGASYTRKMFEVFKKEWVQATNNLTHESLSKNSDEIKYRVSQVNIEKKSWRIVTFRLSDKVDITCSCAKFETHGMLCKHALYVLKKRNVETLPDHYILPRWTLNVRHKVGNGCIGLEDMHNKDEDPQVPITTKGRPKEATRIKSSLEAPKKRRW